MIEIASNQPPLDFEERIPHDTIAERGEKELSETATQMLAEATLEANRLLSMGIMPNRARELLGFGLKVLHARNEGKISDDDVQMLFDQQPIPQEAPQELPQEGSREEVVPQPSTALARWAARQLEINGPDGDVKQRAANDRPGYGD